MLIIRRLKRVGVDSVVDRVQFCIIDTGGAEAPGEIRLAAPAGSVVVFGGVGNLWGTLVGALSLGVVNKFLEPYAGAVLGKIFVLVVVILFIQKRPRGLFALKGRAVES